MAKAPTMDEWAEKLGTKALNGFVYEGRTLREWIDLMASGYCVVLPDGATNGDVVKAVFPHISIKDNCQQYYSVDIENLSGNKSFNTIGFRKEWWDAPYKVGDAE